MPKVTAMPQIRLIVAAASEGTQDSLVGREPSKAAITSPTYAAGARDCPPEVDGRVTHVAVADDEDGQRRDDEARRFVKGAGLAEDTPKRDHDERGGKYERDLHEPSCWWLRVMREVHGLRVCLGRGGISEAPACPLSGLPGLVKVLP